MGVKNAAQRKKALFQKCHPDENGVRNSVNNECERWGIPNFLLLETEKVSGSEERFTLQLAEVTELHIVDKLLDDGEVNTLNDMTAIFIWVKITLGVVEGPKIVEDSTGEK